MYSYICLGYVKADTVAAERFGERLQHCGFLYRSIDESTPVSERRPVISGAHMYIAITSSSAAKDVSIASDIRQAKAQGKDVLCINLEPNELEERYCSADSNTVSVSLPDGDFPDKQSVALFFHRAFVENICRHYICFDPGLCGDDDEGRLVSNAVLAWKGDKESQFELGISYTRGIGVPQMETEAAKWIDRAAAQKLPDALIRMGELRLDGKGIERDTHEAYRLFTLAANRGDLRGIYYMGICCLGGFGIMRDSEMAVRYFYTSAVQGYSPAAYKLGLLYRDGIGIEANWKKAVGWLYRAASPDQSAPCPGKHSYRKSKKYRSVSMRHMRQAKIGDLLFAKKSDVYKGHWKDNANIAASVKECFAVSTYKHMTAEQMLEANVILASRSIDTARCNRGKGYSERIWDTSMAAAELGKLLEAGSPSDSILPDGQAALYWYRAAMRNNHSDSYIYMAACYKRGFGVLHDCTSTFGLYQKAALLGNERAQYNLGVCYERGEGINRNYYEAVRWYEPSAQAGYAPAENNLGGCYEHGIGIEKDLLLAVDWYSKASMQGQPDATCRLGLCYELGRGVMQDTERAVDLYRDAARANHPFAQYRLGVCYDRGIGLHQQFARAAKLYERAARSGLPQAQYAMGLCFRSGRGVYRDERISFEFFKLAADNGCLQACYEVGLCYLEGRSAVTNHERAIKYLQRTLSLYSEIAKDPSLFREDCIPPASAMTITEAAGEALYILAYCKLYGIGEATSDSSCADAFDLYERSAKFGCARAMSALGDLYRLGYGCKPDPEQAKKYYLRAAEANDTWAMYRLGIYDIEDAQNVTPAERFEKYSDAWQKLTASAGHGNPDALIRLAECTSLGLGTVKNEARSISLLERAVNGEGSTEALLWLGDAYLYALGTVQNDELAVSYYTKAATRKRRNLWTDRYTVREAITELTALDDAARAEALYRLAVFYAVNEAKNNSFSVPSPIAAIAENLHASKALNYLGAAILNGHKQALDDLARMFASKVSCSVYYTALNLKAEPMSLNMTHHPSTLSCDTDNSDSYSILEEEITDSMRADALNYLGDCYFYGRGIAKDTSIAVKCYRRAAEGKQTWAQYSLGWCLLNGHGTESSPVEAVKWLAMSASTHADAAFCLARCYEKGIGVSNPDPREALKHYRKAVKLGHKTAHIKVTEMERILKNIANTQ